MEKSEPALVPGWLRGTGNNSGGGNSAHHFPSSSSHSDVPSLSHYPRNRTSKNSGDFDTPHSAFLDRTSSSNSRRGSSNGSAKHAYSSFNRGHREKDREKEKEKLSFGDHWDRDGSDPLGNIFPIRVDQELLRRSHSMVSRKQGEIFPRRVGQDAKVSQNSNHNGNEMLPTSSVSSTIQKAVFDKAFPSLGNEERQGFQDIGRVSSPGLSSAAQSIPFSNSALIGAEGWTSALAEVPSMIGGGTTIPSSSTSIVAGSSSAVQQTAAANPGLGSSSAMTGLNMAEALAQAPSRARTAPQVSVKTQRLEELAIKQSRQLIPVTPSMPKTSVLPSDKLKPKTIPWTTELNVAAKSGQQGSSAVQQANHSFRSGHVKTDVPKASHGKFLVLKPGRENGVSSTQKDSSSPTSNANSAVANSHVAVASVLPAPSRSSNNQNSSSIERKIDPKSGSTLEKRPSMSQVQSRNEFFNLIKMKTSTSVATNSSNVDPTNALEISDEVTRAVVGGPANPHIENGAEMTSNCGDYVKSFSDNEKNSVIPSETVCPDEEEAAFLRSLGWEETSGEDEGLTEEEINSFYQEYMKLKPSLKACRGMRLKLTKASESHGGSVGDGCSDIRPSGSQSEA